MEYDPQPIDTSEIVLTDDLLALTDQLARNTHDVWAKQRKADGWKWGTKRDDIAKENPSLVPYGQLPESEKKYDRNTALEALKVIQILGYRIVRA